jgi:hypothetical protein
MIYNKAQQSLNYWVVALAAITILFALFYTNEALKKSGYASDKQKKVLIQLTLGCCVWLGYLTIASLNNVFNQFDFFPPLIMPLAILPPLVVSLWLTFSKKTTLFLLHVSPKFLVGVQSFRIGVELILWQSFLNGYTPIQMTLEGLNFDIVSGLLALIVLFVGFKNNIPNRWIIIGYNFIGLGLLINIVVIAILSVPSPIRYFMNEPANILIGYFPYIFIPAVYVPIAYTFHFFSLKQLQLLQNK